MSALGSGGKLLTCVVPKGVGLDLLRRLAHELSVVTADVHSARGLSGSDPTGMFSRVEKDVLTVVVPEERAEEVFLWIHREGEVGERPGRFLHQSALRGTTPFTLPEGLPREGD